MTFIEKLQKLKENIESTTIVTLSQRRVWASIIEGVLRDLDSDEPEEDDTDDDDDDYDDAPEDDDETYLSDKASFEVSQALGKPQWKVDNDPEEAVLELCEKVTGGGR